ncbi:MAG: hypothetical protein IJG13_23780 [Kiritimatiellae bacterium]|nr:hypothetical protein [Kiritimatiellia bacterium]
MTGKMIALAIAGTIVLPVCADVVRTDYEPTSIVRQRRHAEEEKGFAPVGSSFAAFGIAPSLEWPARDFEIMGFRFNLIVGDHVDVYGLDLGVFGNFTRREIGGLQLAGLFNVVGESGGALQVAGLFNNSKGAFSGAQVGLFNIVEEGCGVQVGVVNRAYGLSGVQIGVVNVFENSPVSFFPLVNFSF